MNVRQRKWDVDAHGALSALRTGSSGCRRRMPGMQGLTACSSCNPPCSPSSPAGVA